MRVLPLTPNRREEEPLKLLRHGARLPLPDRDLVDAPDRRDLGCGPRQEDLVRDVEHLTRQRLLANWDPRVSGERKHRLTSDAWEKGAVDRRRVDRALPDEEEILSRAFAQHAVRA